MVTLRGQTKNQKGPACLQEGQALIEALLALAFAVVIITAVVIAVITSLNSSSFTKNQNLATQYAQEGLDIARNMRDSDYDGFKALTTDNYHCANEDGTGLNPVSPCEETLDDNFTRKIYVNHSGMDESGVGPRKCEVGPVYSSSFVSSIVSWSDSKCSGGDNCHKIQLDSCFSDPNRQFGT